ncbi:retrovirus-related pol polyprotein from transposon TNT 1-94 [Tanacetum coccineum]
MHEDVYVSQPDGFVDQDNPNHVYKLKKALYGLKQAPRAWYDLLSLFLLSQKFSKGAVDPTLFTRKEGKDMLLVQTYVDDIIFASTDLSLCEKISEIMCSKFKMSMMGKMSFFLGLKISQSLKGIFLNLSKCAIKIIKKYGMETSDPVDTPMYQLLQTLIISQLTDYDLGFDKISLYCDNKSFIALCYNNVHHSRSKHIDIRYHFIKDQVENGVVDLYFVKTEYQLAYIFMKALGRERHDFLTNKLGMRSMSLETLKRLAEEEEE